jgi:hypothetical protein
MKSSHQARTYTGRKQQRTTNNQPQTVNSDQQSTVNSQQSTVNSQQSTVRCQTEPMNTHRAASRRYASGRIDRRTDTLTCRRSIEGLNERASKLTSTRTNKLTSKRLSKRLSKRTNEQTNVPTFSNNETMHENVACTTTTTTCQQQSNLLLVHAGLEGGDVLDDVRGALAEASACS